MIEFGVFDHLDRRPGVPDAQIYADRLALAEAIDRAGFSTYHLAKHHMTPLGLAPAPGVFLAALSQRTQRTQRLRFGPMVYCLPLYEPLRLMEEICMLDHLSGGRFEFGVSRGISPYEVAYLGLDVETARAKYREAFEVIIRGLTHEMLDFSGEFYSYADVPMDLAPLQRPHPPLWYGVAFPAAVDWPAAHGVNVISNAPIAAVREATDRYREIWAAAHDGAVEPKLGVARHMYIAETDAAGEAVARTAYAAWYASFMKLWYRLDDDPGAYADNFDDARRRGQAFAGSPDTAAAEIAHQIETGGLNYFVCRFAFGTLTLEQSRACLALFADEVMPRFAAPAVAAK